jgi:hypothetical protein
MTPAVIALSLPAKNEGKPERAGGNGGIAASACVTLARSRGFSLGVRCVRI